MTQVPFSRELSVIGKYQFCSKEQFGHMCNMRPRCPKVEESGPGKGCAGPVAAEAGTCKQSSPKLLYFPAEPALSVD